MENENVDPERALYKELATIKELKKEVNSLKTRMTKISNSLEQIQLMDFQLQIRNLNEVIENLKMELLKTQRFAAYLQVRVIHDETCIHADEIDVESLNQFTSDVATAFNKINVSETPLNIAENFIAKRWADLKNLGIKSIRIES